MNPMIERLTFVVILTALAQLCWRSNMKAKAVLCGAGAVIFFIGWFLREFQLVRGLAP